MAYHDTPYAEIMPMRNIHEPYTCYVSEYYYGE